MALNIEGASIGFDANNVGQALTNLQTRVIDEANQRMDGKFEEVQDYVNKAWMGESAEAFKDNFFSDKEVVKQALEETHQALKSEMYSIVNAMAEVDQNLVQRRNQ